MVINEFVQVLRLIFLTPFFLITIWLEKLCENWFSLRFPRKKEEILSNPLKFFKLLKKYGKAKKLDSLSDPTSTSSPQLFPPDSTLVKILPLNSIINEPDKNKSAGSFEIVYQSNGATYTLKIFVKFQCGRGFPLWLQAVRAAVEFGIAREINFYQYLAQKVNLRTPHCYYADSINRFNRVCLVLEYIEAFNPADWKGCPLVGIRSILLSVAPMNAIFLDRIDQDSSTTWIPAKKGLDYVSFIGYFLKGEEDWIQRIWAALVNYFKNKPLTLVHGDCRPGNMLFIDDGKLAFKIGNGDNYALSEWPKAVSLPKVIFSDWEATNAAPLFWDFTYCTILGLTIADRRMYQQPLLAEFQDTLQAYGVPKKLWENQASQAEVELLTLILGFLGFIIRKNGFWDKQGNTNEDVKAWHERIFTAVGDVDSKNVAHNLRIPEQLIIQLQNMPWLDLGVGKIKNVIN